MFPLPPLRSLSSLRQNGKDALKVDKCLYIMQKTCIDSLLVNGGALRGAIRNNLGRLERTSFALVFWSRRSTLTPFFFSFSSHCISSFPNNLCICTIIIPPAVLLGLAPGWGILIRGMGSSWAQRDKQNLREPPSLCVSLPLCGMLGGC